MVLEGDELNMASNQLEEVLNKGIARELQVFIEVNIIRY